MKRSGVLVIVIVYVLLVVAILLLGCSSKESAAVTSKKGNIAVSLTDDPAIFSRVNIEILSVLVHYTSPGVSPTGWINLNTRKGIYNLLDFQNNLSVLLAEAREIPEGKINQICLETGNWNSIEIDHMNYPVRMDDKTEGKIKIDLDALIVPGLTTGILFDFDAGKSIRKAGPKDYVLNPVIKIEEVQYH